MRKQAWGGWAMGLAGIAALSGTAFAQDTPKPATAETRPAETAVERPLPALRFDKVPLREVLTRLSTVSGVWVAADSTVGGTLITLDTRGGKLMPVIATLLGMLPKETQVRLSAVPIAKNVPPGDLVAQYLMAQDALRTAKKAAYTPGAPVVLPTEIEVMGRMMDPEKAAPVLSALELKPIFLLTNPASDPMVARALRMQEDNMRLWMDMTPEQRVQLADYQLNGLLNMDSSARKAYFGQMMETAGTMMQKIQNLPPEQRSAFFKDITGGRYDGSTPPPARP